LKLAYALPEVGFTLINPFNLVAKVDSKCSTSQFDLELKRIDVDSILLKALKLFQIEFLENTDRVIGLAVRGFCSEATSRR